MNLLFETRMNPAETWRAGWRAKSPRAVSFFIAIGKTIWWSFIIMKRCIKLLWIENHKIKMKWKWRKSWLLVCCIACERWRGARRAHWMWHALNLWTFFSPNIKSFNCDVKDFVVSDSKVKILQCEWAGSLMGPRGEIAGEPSARWSWLKSFIKSKRLNERLRKWSNCIEIRGHFINDWLRSGF